MNEVAESQLNSDFVAGQVPREARTSALHIALIIIGGTIGFSVFLVAAEIGGSLGYRDSALAFGFGCLILGLLGAATSYVGARSRVSTYVLTQYAFGRQGAKLVNLMIALSLVGWYGVICNFLGQASQQILADGLGINVPAFFTVLVASALMIYVTVKGFTGIDKLALYLVPLMVLFLFYAASRSFAKDVAVESVIPASGAFTLKTAISAVVGTYIAGVIIQPDYSRFAASVRSSSWAVFLALGVAYPLILFLAAVPSLSTGNSDLLQVMAILGLAVPAFLLLTLGAWSSNVLCLYSSGLSIATIGGAQRLKQIVVVLGVLGTALAYVRAQDYLVQFLVILGVTIPPIGAIYVLEATFRRFDFDDRALAEQPAVRAWGLGAWLIGSGVGFTAQYSGLVLTGVASLDALATASLVSALSLLYRAKQK